MVKAQTDLCNELMSQALKDQEEGRTEAVSYTHLDVYKRQEFVHGHPGEFRHASAAHLELQGFRPQGQAMAGGAFLILSLIHI